MRFDECTWAARLWLARLGGAWHRFDVYRVYLGLPLLRYRALDPETYAPRPTFARLLSPGAPRLRDGLNGDQLLDAIQTWVGPVWSQRIRGYKRLRQTKDLMTMLARQRGETALYAAFNGDTRLIEIDDMLWEHLSRVAAGERDPADVLALVYLLHEVFHGLSMELRVPEVPGEPYARSHAEFVDEGIVEWLARTAVAALLCGTPDWRALPLEEGYASEYSRGVRFVDAACRGASTPLDGVLRLLALPTYVRRKVLLGRFAARAVLRFELDSDLTAEAAHVRDGSAADALASSVLDWADPLVTFRGVPVGVSLLEHLYGATQPSSW